MAPEPLVTHIYTADPSAHVFEGKIYVYPSHVSFETMTLLSAQVIALVYKRVFSHR